MRFKTVRIANEWESDNLDKRLRVIVIFLDWYCLKFLKRDIQLTCIHRTQKEQNAIYGGNPKYQKKPWKSVHQFQRGIDIGVNAFTTEVKQILCNMLNKRFSYKGNYKTCVWHDVGLGDHFHIQVDGTNETKILK